MNESLFWAWGSVLILTLCLLFIFISHLTFTRIPPLFLTCLFLLASNYPSNLPSGPHHSAAVAVSALARSGTFIGKKLIKQLFSSWQLLLAALLLKRFPLSDNIDNYTDVFALNAGVVLKDNACSAVITF